MKAVMMFAFFTVAFVAAEKDYCVNVNWKDVFYEKQNEKFNEIETSCVQRKSQSDFTSNCKAFSTSNDYTCSVGEDTCEEKYIFMKYEGKKELAKKEKMEETTSYESKNEPIKEVKVEEKPSNEKSDNTMFAICVIVVLFVAANSSGEDNGPKNRRKKNRRR